jgi:hypothetical protein
MGVFKMFSSSRGGFKGRSIGGFSFSSHDSSKNQTDQTMSLPNPDSSNYKVIRHRRIKDKLVIEIQYLDCTNYEGRKILVFDKCVLKDLIQQGLIDPHFSESKDFKSPIARFIPTEKGWDMAMKFAFTY